MPPKHSIACKNCSLYRLCLPTGVTDEDLSRLDAIIVRHPSIEKGQHWFRAGDAVQSVCAIRSGTVKTHYALENGAEQIAGFHLPGELIGLDAIYTDEHSCSATALETTSICEIPFHQLDKLSTQIPELHRQMMRIMSKEMRRDRSLILLLGKKTAEQRVAWLLHRIASGLEQRHYSGREFFLSMSRNDIGNYLGLTVETVSRIFTRFKRRKLLRVEGKHITLLDVELLCHLAGASLA
jgi:CRP/FNR family transcriptional regulator, anaerobic regulatory protein